MKPSEIGRAIGAECLCFRSRRVARVLTRVYDEALRPLGIQATQLTLMSAIAGPGEEGQTMGGLSQILAMDPTTLSRNLRPLEKEGLVEIGRSEKDKRVRVAKLTPEGEHILAEALPRWRTAQEKIVRSLGDEAAVDLRGRLDSTAAAALAGLSG